LLALVLEEVVAVVVEMEAAAVVPEVFVKEELHLLLLTQQVH